MLFNSERYLILLPLVVILYGFMFFLLRKRISGFLDPLNIAIIYVSFGLIGLGRFVYSNNVDAQVFYLTVLWVSVFVSVLNLSLYVNVSKSAGLLSLSMRDSLGYSRAMLWSIRIIYVLYFFVIMKSGVLSGNLSTIVDERFKVFQDSKVLFYIFNSVSMLPAVAIYMCNGRISFFHFVMKIFPFWCVQLLTFSKTGFVFPILQFAIYYSLVVFSINGARVNILKYLSGAVLASAFVLVVFYIVAEFLSNGIGGEMAINLLLSRLFTSYDALSMYSTLHYANEPNSSIMQWYFSPYLKAIGLFDQYYNSANYYLAVNYFGFSNDYTGMLPNNNNVLEICLAFPVVVRPLAIVVFSGAYALMYRFSFIISSKCPLLVIPFGFVYSTPFGFLVDGQGWFIALSTSFIVLLIHIGIFTVMQCSNLFRWRT